MIIFIAIASILGIAAITWLLNRWLPFTICPICAGVFLTWSGLVVAHFLGYPVTLIVPALLMGGSAVGIAYQLEKRKEGSPQRALLMKVLLVPAGFLAAYALLEREWMLLAGGAAAAGVVVLWFLIGGQAASAGNSALEEKMDDCC